MIVLRWIAHHKFWTLIIALALIGILTSHSFEIGQYTGMLIGLWLMWKAIRWIVRKTGQKRDEQLH